METSIGMSRPFWRGEASVSSRYCAVNTEEASVARDWGHELTDAHRHPLFPLFQQHLEGDPSLRLLEEAEKANELYAAAYQKLLTFISRRLMSELHDLRPADLKGMASSLVMDAGRRLSNCGGLNFPYIPARTNPLGIEGLPPAWHLELGFWRVGNAGNPEALTRIAQVHKLLVEEIPTWDSYDQLKKSSEKAQEGIREFQRSLNPDARLR